MGRESRPVTKGGWLSGAAATAREPSGPTLATPAIGKVASAMLGGAVRDPQLERNVHRSQNRIESYHQLRTTIAQVGGKKEMTGRTDIEIPAYTPKVTSACKN